MYIHIQFYGSPVSVHAACAVNLWETSTWPHETIQDGMVRFCCVVAKALSIPLKSKTLLQQADFSMTWDSLDARSSLFTSSLYWIAHKFTSKEAKAEKKMVSSVKVLCQVLFKWFVEGHFPRLQWLVISPLLHILPATQTVWKISAKKSGSNNNIKKHHIPLISASFPCHQPPPTSLARPYHKEQRNSRQGPWILPASWWNGNLFTTQSWPGQKHPHPRSPEIAAASSRLTLLAPVREARRISAPPACSSLRRVISLAPSHLTNTRCNLTTLGRLARKCTAYHLPVLGGSDALNAPRGSSLWQASCLAWDLKCCESGPPRENGLKPWSNQKSAWFQKWYQFWKESRMHWYQLSHIIISYYVWLKVPRGANET